jgi:hypothetical protein
MQWRELLHQWGLSGLTINPGVLAADFHPSDEDKDAAWALYVELLTRITTQPLPQEQGDERAALESVHQLFALTRDILRSTGGRHAREFAKIAIVLLNQQVRPFTSKWYRLSLTGGFDGLTGRQEFRAELALLQDVLLRYARLLGSMAGIEGDDDLTRIEAA